MSKIDSVDIIDFNKYTLEHRRETCWNKERSIITTIENTTSRYPFLVYICRDIPHIATSNDNTQNNTDIISPLNQPKRSAKDNSVEKNSTENKGKFNFF